VSLLYELGVVCIENTPSKNSSIVDDVLSALLPIDGLDIVDLGVCFGCGIMVPSCWLAMDDFQARCSGFQPLRHIFPSLMLLISSSLQVYCHFFFSEGMCL
jgi:hypothetical protein